MLNIIPYELQCLIISYIPLSDLFELALTNVYFYHLTTETFIPKITRLPKKIQAASKSGKISILKFIELTYPTNFTKIIQRDPWPLNFSIEYDYPVITNYLLNRNAKSNVYSLNQACLYDDIDLVKKLVLCHHVFPNNKTLDICSKTGNVDITTFMINQGELFTSHSLQVAASMGHLEIVKLLVCNNTPVNHHIANVAQINNQSRVLKYLESLGYYPSSSRVLKNKIKNYKEFYNNYVD